MPRTCSRMKVSASPKPASGAARGRPGPIFMARDCALAGMTRNTAGAATAPMPTLTSVRRESGRDDESFMITSLDFSRVAFARLFQMLHDLGPQRRLLLGRPFAKPFAALETELAGRHQLVEIGRGPGRAVDRRQHRLVDRTREVRAHQDGLLQRAENREPPA